MCLLPPQCLFCRHYNADGVADGPDCSAFDEIPEDIFRSRVDHVLHYAGDGGVRFDLRPEMADAFDEVNALRAAMQLTPFRRTPPDRD